MDKTENSKLKTEYMKLALKLAAKGNPSPNPYVGAVIVKDGKVIGQGFHRKAGMPHAEVEAISDALAKGRVSGLQSRVSKLETRDWKPPFLAGATMYVTLEPCNHYGRTPPCTKAIIEAGISKVVFAAKDPNPNVAGGGEEELRKNGISVEGGHLAEESLRLNEVFVKYARTKIPFVVVKAAMSLDGKIATRTGDSKWITGEKARKYSHKLRSRYDAVLVGINTVLADNPHLTARVPKGRDPLRVVLDDTLRIPLDANVARKGTIVATSERFDKGTRAGLEAKEVQILVCGKERVDLKALLEKLGEMGITSLLVEGGAEVQGSFLDAKLADKFVLFYAPKLMGGKGAKCAFAAEGAQGLADAVDVRIERMKKIGNDILIEAYPRYR